MSKISSKRQVTLSAEVLRAVGLKAGDEVTIEADGADRIVLRSAERDVRQVFGVFDGLYESDYLKRLRSEEQP